MIQSVIFDKKYYTLKDAHDFINHHNNLKVTKAPDVKGNFIRFRQQDPDSSKYHYVTHYITDGVAFIIGYPK